MYELGIMLVATTYGFMQLLEEGIEPLIILITLMTYLLGGITLQIYCRTTWYIKWFKVYIGLMVIIGFCIHPSFALLAFVNGLLYHQTSFARLGVMGGISLISYAIYYGSIAYSVLFVHIIIYLQGIYTIKLKERIQGLQKVVSDLRDKANTYEKGLEQLHLYNEQLHYTTQIAERNQIAQRLHDKLGHTLAGNIMRLEATKIILDQDKEAAKLQIQGITDDLRQGMDQIRGVLKELKPTESEVGIHTIKEMLGNLEAHTSVHTNFEYKGDMGSIDYIKWRVIVDNLLEAITNLKKHSNATMFTVRILQFNQILKVEIEDNGEVELGFKKNLGLRGIEERMVESRGSVRFNLDNGFKIIMIWVEKE